MAASISEAMIRHHTTANSWNQGEDYYQGGAVTDIVQRGNTISAEVEGSDVRPYRIDIQLDAGGVKSAHCSCPYVYEGWCKHIVAAALTSVRQPKRIQQRPTLSQLLDRLDHVKTQQLVQALVEEQPTLIDVIDRQVTLLSASAAPAQTTPARRRASFDTTPFRRQVKQILREGVRCLEDGYDDDPFTDALLNVVEKTLNFARNGDGYHAIAILSAITETYVGEWDELCEYGGDSFSITDPLDEAWTEAILSTDLNESEAVDLGVMLDEWQDSLDADFSMSLAALQQGWDDPELQRVLNQGRGYSDPARLESSFGQKLAQIRLQILDRQGRQQEYLNLARVEGLILQYLTRLAQTGQIEAAMEVAQERMTTAEEAFALAQVLREGEHLTEALAIAQAGLPLTGNCCYTLADWTSNLAEGMGNLSVALEASIRAFQLQPNFSDYRRAAHLATDQWECIKPDLLNMLRQSSDWQNREAKVDIFLYEGLLDDAIRAVETDTYYRSELLYRVMQATTSTHSDWVIKTARKQAEPIMSQGKSDRYQEAVKWLQQAKTAYEQSGQKSTWTDYFNRLQVDYGRKRKLMDLFNQLR
ncbi:MULTISPECIES: SWIM zinc finger family protein [unclassified Leptolyngbya]|uniref:SWIM zinc finger family protein n=1 Tax=unclassified Leptolyngbya TaxID=2650499 RepID=UPI00168720EF|nr:MULTISPECIES: SWIM zinc finger family protein [unclassified Leptolyngbya]MBD1913171.1 SWIM zinc finger domain-containing protein [Leptolyngbya sp. FACHB-8]MBD2158790.1 SWIM zinc finger domain-containing protein [Leptolyngbya sp. FACHB-16]